jgi:hypothetical protein
VRHIWRGSLTGSSAVRAAIETRGPRVRWPARPFEIEHIWADHPDRFVEWFPHWSEFDTARNRIGGLLLLSAA